MRQRSRAGRGILAGVLVLTASACGANPPGSPGPSAASPPAHSAAATPPPGPPMLGIDWGRAASVERPQNYDGDASAPPYTGTHPILRIPGQAMMVDAVADGDAGFVAIGYVPPAWTPAAWTSADGSTWVYHAIGPSEFTFPVALARGADDTLVAVGRSGPSPTAWTSRNGVDWVSHAAPVSGGVAERMTSVVATDRGYLAGGSVGPELFERHARFWTSADGSAWQAVPDDPTGFADAEVRSITRFGAGFVAVGVVGTAQKPAGAVAWTSSDGTTWTRIDAPAFADGLAVAVIPAPFGGLVAVGSDVARHEAVTWTSPDGRSWTRAAGEASRQHAGGYVWMTDVVAIDDEVIAVGDYQGLQRGTATSWVSRDGLRWEQARSAPIQEQGEFYAIVPGGPGAIAVGSFGAPDSYVPTVWLSPAR